MRNSEHITKPKSHRLKQLLNEHGNRIKGSLKVSESVNLSRIVHSTKKPETKKSVAIVERLSEKKKEVHKDDRYPSDWVTRKYDTLPSLNIV